MSDCTVADVLSDAMVLLGDSAGEITQEIVTFFNVGYADLLNLMLKCGTPEIQREVYFTLPANTNVLFPSQLGVTDFAEPSQIWERGSVSQATVVSTSNTTPITVTTSTAVSGPRVELNGVSGVPGWVNRDWIITVTGPLTFTLNGSIAPGAAGTGGTAMWSPETLTPMRQPDVSPPAPDPISADVLGTWKWQQGNLYFPGSSLPRQLWIEYLADDSAPASGVIGIANGRERSFLAHATAARFALGPDQMPIGPTLMNMAYGQNGEPDGSGGLLRSLIVPIIQQTNQRQRRMGLYRPR